MKIIATWNVNSVRARLPVLVKWLSKIRPDVVLLQELKCLNSDFPTEEIEDLGYNLALYGQKTFNGVGILSKEPIEDVICGLPSFPEDSQARYIEAIVGGTTRVASVYVPNGQSIDSEKYLYKLEFLHRLYLHLADRLLTEDTFVVGGDFNVAPSFLDVPEDWGEEILCSPNERRAFRSLLNLGYKDALRIFHQEGNLFTWWDYRANAFHKNRGLRIDHLLLSPQAADKVKDSQIDRQIREEEKTSDHAPVWCQL